MSKELEELKILKFLVANCSHFEFDFTNIEKELKALEIIKKYIYVNKPFESACYIRLNDESEMITEEEYNLLKEVLL